jgi:hypothetical protein
MAEESGWLWFVIDVGAVAVFGVALLYGTMMYRRRRTPPVAAPEYREDRR